MQHVLLLVDDEFNVLRALERTLRSNDYTIFTASNGEMALQLLGQHDVQVIISDQRMPYMTGSEFLTQVKKLYPNTIRMILSGYADFDAVKDAINEGAIYKFLSKPWDADVLRSHVKEAFHIYELHKNDERQLMRSIYYDEVPIQVDVELELENDLRQALEKQQLVLYYQPIVTVDGEKLVGVEALLRWRHPQKGLLMPDQFMHVCELTGLIVPVGEWVLLTACQQLMQWYAMGYHTLNIAVNLSVRQFASQQLYDVITTVLKSTKIPPACLKLEITESTVMQNVEANMQFLQSLCDLGLQLVLDDFGTGYSSLSYLKRFPFAILKIDKTFIHDAARTNNDESIVSTIIVMCKRLGLKIVAEGVETEAQLALLKKLKCDYMQGFLYSKPVSAEELTQLLLRTAPDDDKNSNRSP